MAEGPIEPIEEKKLKTLSDEELAEKKAELEAEIEERELETEDEGLVYHGAYEDVPVVEARTSKGQKDNIKEDYWVCTAHGCNWLNPASAVRCEVCGRPRSDAFISKYW